jgi:hypothetical protein
MHFMISSLGREPGNIVHISTHGLHQILVYRFLDPSWSKKIDEARKNPLN